jgi:hypothetical protein
MDGFRSAVRVGTETRQHVLLIAVLGTLLTSSPSDDYLSALGASMVLAALGEAAQAVARLDDSKRECQRMRAVELRMIASPGTCELASREVRMRRSDDAS